MPDWAAKINAADTGKERRARQLVSRDKRSPAQKPFCTMDAAQGRCARSAGSLDASPWGNEMIEELRRAGL